MHAYNKQQSNYLTVNSLCSTCSSMPKVAVYICCLRLPSGLHQKGRPEQLFMIIDQLDPFFFRAKAAHSSLFIQ